MYPAWPSKESLDQLRDKVVTSANQPGGKRVFFDIQRIHEEIPFFSAKISGLPVFLKEEYFGLGRGSFDEEIQIGGPINGLRKICPNFNTTLANLTSTTGPRTLLTEYTPGPTIREFIWTKPPFLEVFSLFVQSILAMELAHSEIGLSHGDLLTSNVIGRLLPERKLVQYSDVWISTDRIPVIYDFDRSSLNREDLRRDIYTLLFSSFRDYSEQFNKLLKWYGVKFGLQRKHSETIQEESPKLILRSGKDLIKFGQETFGYNRRPTIDCPVLVPEDIIF